jgi:DNA-binding NtrC family response regulator
VRAEVRRSSTNGDGVLLGLEFDTPLQSLRIAPREPVAQEASAPRKILVVDDQSGIRGLLSRYLSEQGLEVRSAADGEEAFRLLLAEFPDIMLLDLYLPRLNGHDLLRRMQEMDISVGLIFTMSGYADAAGAQECLRLGATDHLMKPIDLDRLHRNIQLRV